MSYCDASQWALVVGTLARSAPLAVLLEVESPDLKITRTPYIRHPQTTFRHLSHPNFSVFTLFQKNFSPN